MIKVRVIEQFTLEDFDKLKNIQRVNLNAKTGTLYTGDIFECTQTMAEYLTGDNRLNKKVVDIMEVIPEKKGK